jgi:tripartite-type tricarboxylate transporter receptor subunit TctC
LSADFGQTFAEDIDMGRGGQVLRHHDAVIGSAGTGASGNAAGLARRELLRLGAAAAGLAAMPRAARAQPYPARAVRLIVGLAAGGGQDIVARLIGQWLSERLGRQFVVENRPGASGNLALEAVANAPPDGYTLALLGVNNAINASLYSKLGFEFLRDIAPVAGIMRVPLVMVVHPSFPAATVPEFIAYAKANPGTINMGSGGVGTSIHVSGELFKMMTGVEMLHVPYRGGMPALTGLIGGQVQVMFDTMPESIGFIRAGTLRPIAVTTATRSPTLPDLPTIGDYLPGYEASAWYGLGAPRNTSAEIVERLNQELNAGLADAAIKARLADLGGTVIAGTPGDFGKFIADDVEKWAKVVKFAGVKAE